MCVCVCVCVCGGRGGGDGVESRKNRKTEIQNYNVTKCEERVASLCHNDIKNKTKIHFTGLKNLLYRSFGLHPGIFKRKPTYF